MKTELNIGIVGACGRGSSFRKACDALPEVNLLAVCDANEAELPKAAALLGAKEQYTDYESMLEKSNLDAVIIGTPMQFHAPMAIAALERNIAVLSEVTAAVSLEESKDLVRACRQSKGVYMMAENYIYSQANTAIKELVRRGMFGTTYYAEGEYLHELKHMNEQLTPWRRKWQTGIDGITYGTHSLGPILQWMPGDRVVRVSCEGAGSHHVDNKGNPYCQASSTMLCKMASGGLVKIRVDMVSDRPHAMGNYQLQGTDGCYESGRGFARDHIWLRDRCPDANTWLDLEEILDEFLPDYWKENMEKAKGAGHGGGDYFEILDFVEAVKGIKPSAIGIDEAMDMTLPGLISQKAIVEGKWMEVPDSRDW